jgi:hypothetical protein
MLDSGLNVVLVDALVHTCLREWDLSDHESMGPGANFNYISLEELRDKDEATGHQKDIYAFARTAYEVRICKKTSMYLR